MEAWILVIWLSSGYSAPLDVVPVPYPTREQCEAALAVWEEGGKGFGKRDRHGQCLPVVEYRGEE